MQDEHTNTPSQAKSPKKSTHHSRPLQNKKYKASDLAKGVREHMPEIENNELPLLEQMKLDLKKATELHEVELQHVEEDLQRFGYRYVGIAAASSELLYRKTRAEANQKKSQDTTNTVEMEIATRLQQLDFLSKTAEFFEKEGEKAQQG